MRYLLSVAVLIFCIAVFSHQPSYGKASAATSHIEFRLLLESGDMAGKEFDTIVRGAETLNIWKAFFLRDNDIAEALIFKSATVKGRLMAGFSFNDSGKNNLSVITKKFPNHRIAIFADGNFITVLPAQFMHSFSDVLVIIWPRKEEELRKIVRDINKRPESILSLYIDETVKYNDVAAEEWAKVYQHVSSSLETVNKKKDFEKKYE